MRGEGRVGRIPLVVHPSSSAHAAQVHAHAHAHRRARVVHATTCMHAWV